VGYNIAVTRGAAAITLAEWADVVASDPALDKIGAPQITPTIPEGETRYHAVRSAPYDGPDWPGVAQLTSHHDFPATGGWLYWDRGKVVVKNPDEVMLAKLCEIAAKLDARVQGEEGEYYE
jgi:hypothetical protein